VMGIWTVTDCCLLYA